MHSRRFCLARSSCRMLKQLQPLFFYTAKNILANKQISNVHFNSYPVPDQFVALVKIDIDYSIGYGSSISFTRNAITGHKIRAVTNADIRILQLPTIALVLESPHVEEFKDELAPAKGRTGQNISKYLLRNLLNYLTTSTEDNIIRLFANNTISNGVYRLLLINPIQYQCSLGVSRKGIRDKVFSECWKNHLFVNDFVKRLKLSQPTIIINCCTGGQQGGDQAGLQKMVQKVIDKHFGSAIRIYGYHPSTFWFPHGFLECK